MSFDHPTVALCGWVIVGLFILLVTWPGSRD